MIASAVRNLRVIFTAAFLNGTHNAMTRALLQPFVLTLTRHMALVGFVDGLTNSLGPCVQVAGGWFSDRIGRRLPLILGSVCVIVASIVFLAAEEMHALAGVILGAALLGAGTVGAPAREALVADSIDIRRRRFAFSLLAVCVAAPGIFASYLGGRLVQWRDGYGVIFIVMGALELAVLGLFAFGLRETSRGSLSDHMRPERFREVIRHVLHVDPRLRTFLALIAIDGFLWGTGYKIMWGLLKGAQDLTPGEIGLLASASIAAWVVFMAPISFVMSRWGCRTCLILSEICGGLGLIGVMFFHGSGVSALLPCVMLTGLVPAFWVPAVRVLMVNSVGQEHRAEGLGKLALFTGASGFLGGIVGGLLYQASSIVVPLAVNVAGAAAMVVALLVFIRESPQNEITS